MLYADTPVQFLKGVGPKLGTILKKKGIQTVEDLLNNFPRTYEDRRAGRNIASLKAGELVCLEAEVINVRSYNLGRSRRKIYDVGIRDSSGVIRCKYFRVPYKGYFDRFQARTPIRVTGKVTLYRGNLEFHHPEIQEQKAQEEISDALIPIYSETEGLTSSRWRKIVQKATSSLKSGEIKGFSEKFPAWLLKKYKLEPREETFLNLHEPPEGAGEEYIELRSPFHRRVIFEEFFWLEMLLAAKKKGVQKEKAPALEKGEKLCKQFTQQLPFSLTGAQKKAFEEILNDLQKDMPMHRLVQGDVGSGKTMVALLSSLVAIESGYQAALMVPTEILAQQHYLGAKKWFDSMGIQVDFLSGHLKSKEKKEVYQRLASGETKLIVGTHALIQEAVEYHKLGLVIVDEQHRFGVEQRVQLKRKGQSPHFLLMTATPIPRSLAMTVYGDLDVSIIDEMPKGRQPIVTRVTYHSRRQKVLQFVQEQISKGRQAYVVYPLVDESDKMELTSAIQEFEKLEKELPDLRIGLVHGKMKSDEKDKVMDQFRKQELDILVSTTVIEVGVDVPNANIMWIDHAERFGLSQLHQLRGRVGRGEHKSYCILMLGYAVSQESRERIEIMERTSDGFKIAEADLELRGPGEFMGSRQSGLPGFKMANLIRDLDILKDAREAAFEVLRKDPQLSRSEHRLIKEQLGSKEILG